MLDAAAWGGHREICEIAREWGARDFHWMSMFALENKHYELCELADKWQAETHSE
jgi:hypothetical protein